MALGDLGKAQRMLVKAKGWNPDVIEGFGTDMANWDKAPNPWQMGDQSVGKLPDAIPDQQNDFPLATEAPLSETVQFNHPNFAGGSEKHRATLNADVGE